MATLAAAPRRARNDRLFYTGMGALVLLLAIAGFARSYYLAGWFETPAGTPEITLLLHAHGAACTLWLALMVIQPLLIAGKNRRLHRRLGWFGLGVAVAMVLLGNAAAIAAMHVGFIGLGDPLVFYAVPFFAINSFAVTAFFAFLWRERAETHKRLILLANVAILNAAVARIPLAAVQSGAPFTFTFLPDVIVLAGILYDWRTRGRIHRVWIWGGLAMLVSQIVMFPVMGSAAWHGFAEAMAGLWGPPAPR
ncbi:MAG TPA: hypothetical protein VF603_00865 [Allosphingosinicella sp.]